MPYDKVETGGRCPSEDTEVTYFATLKRWTVTS
ncbi:MAG: hypothetical protein ACI9G1_002468, partial [Pirellulaceae bacterium]